MTEQQRMTQALFRPGADTVLLFVLVRAFLGLPIAQLGKNLPAVWETWVQSLG